MYKRQVQALAVGQQHPGRQARQALLGVAAGGVGPIQPELARGGAGGFAADQLAAACDLLDVYKRQPWGFGAAITLAVQCFELGSQRFGVRAQGLPDELRPRARPVVRQDGHAQRLQAPLHALLQALPGVLPMAVPPGPRCV